jgi:hypothetical protein
MNSTSKMTSKIYFCRQFMIKYKIMNITTYNLIKFNNSSLECSSQYLSLWLIFVQFCIVFVWMYFAKSIFVYRENKLYIFIVISYFQYILTNIEREMYCRVQQQPLPSSSYQINIHNPENYFFLAVTQQAVAILYWRFRIYRLSWNVVKELPLLTV